MKARNKPVEPLTRLAPPVSSDTSVVITPNYTQYAYVPAVDGLPEAYDGDTLRLDIDMGQHCWVRDLNYRLYGINAPEINRAATKRDATASRDYLRTLIQTHQLRLPTPPGGGFWLVVRTHKQQRKRDYRPIAQQGKFGRYLVELFGKAVDGSWVNLNEKMLAAKHATVYVG